MASETQGQILRAIPDGIVGHAKGLKQGRRGPGSPEYEFDVLNSLEYDTVFMDFRAATMPVDQIGAGGVLQYEEDNGGSTAFAKLAPTIARPSDIKGIVDNSNPSAIALVGVPQFLSEMNPFIEFCFELSVITTLELGLGFVDANPGSAGDIINDVDDGTLVGLTEGVMFGLDTAQTLKTATLMGENGGSASDTVASPTAAPFGIPTAATKVVWRVELRDDRAYAFVNGALVAKLDAGEGAATGVLLAPHFYVGSRSAAAKDVHIDYIFMGQERADLLV